MSTFTTQQVTDMLVQVVSKSAGLEGFNVVDVAGVDANTLTFKVLVPGGHPNSGDAEASPPTDRYTLKTVTVDVAVT